MPLTALITGGPKRLGAAMSLALAESGWNIALHFHSSRPEAQELQSRIESLGVKCTLHQANLQSSSEANRLLMEVLELNPRLEVLVNNASVFDKSSLVEVTEDVFDRQFNLNFRTPFFLMQKYSGSQKTGHIVNILDTKISTNQAPNYTAYNLSKKALMHLTQMAALDFAPGIRVNAIAPGPVLPAEGISESEFQRIVNETPLQHEISPQAIGRALIYLIDNPSLTGQILYFDNGSHLI